MAFIQYPDPDEIPARDRVADDDNIIRIHGVNSPVMGMHYRLYAELMRGRGPLTLVQREMVATVVSAINRCHY